MTTDTALLARMIDSMIDAADVPGIGRLPESQQATALLMAGAAIAASSAIAAKLDPAAAKALIVAVVDEALAQYAT